MFRRLSKLLFPHLPSDQRQRRVNTMLLVLALAGTIAAAVALALLYFGKK